MNTIIGGKRCKGIGTTIGLILLFLLLLACVGGGVFTYNTIKNSKNRKIKQEEI